MKKYFVSLLCLISLFPITGQSQVFEWAKAFFAHNGDMNPSVNNIGRSIAVDGAGNVFSAGFFDHTVDFDPGPAVFAISADNWAYKGLYLSKLSSAGDFLWALKISSYIEGGDIAIDVDKEGNVYVCSQLRLAWDFDPGPDEFILSPKGSMDAFIAKYSADGALVWAKQFGGEKAMTSPDILNVDEDGNIIVGGSFIGTVDFDPSSTIHNLTASAHSQAYIVKLDRGGDLIWARQFGHGSVSNASTHLTDVKTDAIGNIYLSGRFGGTCDFDPGPNQYLLKSAGTSDLIVVKLSSQSDFIWAAHIASTSSPNYYHTLHHGMDIDGRGNVYLTGSFIGSFDFDPGPGKHVINSQGGYDWYLLKLDSQGNFLWVDVFTSSEYDIGEDVAMGTDGIVYVVGSVGNNIDIDPGPGVHTLTTLNSYGGAALLKIDSETGGLIHASLFDLITADWSSQLYPSRLRVDSDHNIYITGQSGGSVDLDPGEGKYTLGTDIRGNASPFALKLSRCANISTSAMDITSCNTFEFNNKTFDSTGIYRIIVPNSAGCDSIITLNLVINKMVSEKSVAICEGESYFAEGAERSVAGIYVDTLKSSTDCDSIIITHLSVNPIPKPFLGPDRDLCSGDQVSVSPGVFDEYLWQDFTTEESFTVNKPGLYWVEVSNQFKCKTRDSIWFSKAHSLPSGFLKATDSVCSGLPLSIQPTKQYKKYLWSTGSFRDQISVAEPGTYWLTVTDENGCSGTDSTIILPKSCIGGIYIPNAFTPNADGLNDVFMPLIKEPVNSYNLAIYNRWGKNIFKTTDPSVGWDGRYSGEPQEAGIFIWVCVIELKNGKVERLNGTVTLIR